MNELIQALFLPIKIMNEYICYNLAVKSPNYGICYCPDKSPVITIMCKIMIAKLLLVFISQYKMT